MSEITNSKYKTIFFDLDRTLWDYRLNSEETLKDLLNEYAPELNHQFEEFLHVFYTTNDSLWLEYRDGKIAKETLSTLRFIRSFKRFGVDVASRVAEISNFYITESPKKSRLFPHTIETMVYLRKRGYRLILLTNGFLEVQKVKIRESKLEPYFEQMITSEEAGYQKPDKRIFEFAFKALGVEKNESVMIGDDLDNDISGAQNFGIDTVFFNPQNKAHESEPTYEIKSLDELQLIF